jgi:hypothetical protein
MHACTSTRRRSALISFSFSSEGKIERGLWFDGQRGAVLFHCKIFLAIDLRLTLTIEWVECYCSGRARGSFTGQLSFGLLGRAPWGTFLF